mmetsp:Transcript_49650/g.56243  ORF Transcript_49650/g.56243 Transcript_49650/m.56243 type:complete len:223 (-) Transcript_49650:80-748(-)
MPIAASPISATMPHFKESQLSPLTHRHTKCIENGHGHMNGTPNLNNNNVDHHQQQQQPTIMTTTTQKLSSSSSNKNSNSSSKGSDNNNKVNNKHNLSLMLRNPTAICAGFVGGALMGAFGTGGPAFLIYAKEAGWQRRPELFRANLQLLFFVINVPVCFSQYLEGIITWQRCTASMYLLPSLIIGGHIGGILATKVPRDKFQLLVVNGLRIMGVMFLIEATR